MLHMSNCTVSNNTAGRDGGGIDFDALEGLLPIINSTISGNRANRHGGGIGHNSRDGVLNLNFVTLTNNIADDDADGVGEGGGVDINATSGTVTLNIHNSIVQGNDDETPAQTSADDCGNSGGIGTSVSQGGNVFGSGTGCPVSANDTTDPANLGPLQNNGGTTETHALLAGSAAINFADCDTVTVDQIGNPRPFGGACDAGAVESSFGPAVKAFVFLANKITLSSTKQVPSYGDMHSNGTLTVNKGDNSTYYSNLTAIGKITIGKYDIINGDVRSQTSISNSGTINGTKTIGPVANQPLPSLSYSAGGPNKTVSSGHSLSLAPGSYGIVTLNGSSTLKLTSGVYFMNELRYSSTIKDGVIEIDLSSGNPVTINVVSNLQLGHSAAIRLLPNGESDSKLVTFNTLQSTAANWGREAYLLGSFNAPNAVVTLVKNTQLRGVICAKEIVVSTDCLFLHHLSPGSLPGPGNLPKPAEVDESEVATSEVVTDYALEQNYPNPFNPSTSISFALPEAGAVSLAIYNTNGQLVKTLISGEMNAGRHNVIWDATDARGERVTSGVYLYVLKAGEFTAQRKLVLMK
jgi:FlgD Ig-like domain